MLYLLVQTARDTKLARPRNSGQTGGSVDALAINLVCIRDHMPKIDANPILDPAASREQLVALDDGLPDDNAALCGFNGVLENRNKSIRRAYD